MQLHSCGYLHLLVTCSGGARQAATRPRQSIGAQMSLTEQSAPSVKDFMDDPIGFFGESLTQMHSIPEVNDLNDVVPLFFSHTAFKSYPAALIDNKRFDLMTKWLDKLTSHDLS